RREIESLRCGVCIIDVDRHYSVRRMSLREYIRKGCDRVIFFGKNRLAKEWERVDVRVYYVRVIES
uniref:hypothetical protein n=1 Tax=Paenibacillus xylanexedens TaxID=528191 RepID=UPI001C92D783